MVLTGLAALQVATILLTAAVGVAVATVAAGAAGGRSGTRGVLGSSPA